MSSTGRVLVAGDCTYTYSEPPYFCGAATTHLQLDVATGAVVHVLCSKHAISDDQPIAAPFVRAERTSRARGSFRVPLEH